MPMISCRFQYDSASLTVSSGFHFVPQLTVLLACQNFSSLDGSSVLFALALALNSSTTDETGKWSLEVLLYRLTKRAKRGTPSHLHTNLLYSLCIKSYWKHHTSQAAGCCQFHAVKCSVELWSPEDWCCLSECSHSTSPSVRFLVL